MENLNMVKDVFNSFNKLKALIIGDVMIDSYLWGRVNRISPEAPVPIVALDKREYRLGGAANVALNIKSLGATPLLFSAIGQDDKSELFLELMEKENLDTTGIIKSPHRLTTTKFRVMGNNMQLLRVDEESMIKLQNDEMTSLMKIINNMVEKKNVDVIIFQDYDKGVISQQLILSVVSLANANNIPVVVDPKKNNFLFYRNVALFKPNLKELKEGLKIDVDIDENEQLEIAVHKLVDKIKATMVLLTLSDRGVLVCSRSDDRRSYNYRRIPAHVRKISDVSGAGDTVIAVAALCTAISLEPEMTAELSNMAGGLVCEHAGVVPVNKEKLMEETVKLFC